MGLEREKKTREAERRRERVVTTVMEAVAVGAQLGTERGDALGGGMCCGVRCDLFRFAFCFLFFLLFRSWCPQEAETASCSAPKSCRCADPRGSFRCCTPPSTAPKWGSCGGPPEEDDHKYAATSECARAKSTYSSILLIHARHVDARHEFHSGRPGGVLWTAVDVHRVDATLVHRLLERHWR